MMTKTRCVLGIIFSRDGEEIGERKEGGLFGYVPKIPVKNPR